jgi:hypothetical protein
MGFVPETLSGQLGVVEWNVDGPVGGSRAFASTIVPAVVWSGSVVVARGLCARVPFSPVAVVGPVGVGAGVARTLAHVGAVRAVVVVVATTSTTTTATTTTTTSTTTTATTTTTSATLSTTAPTAGSR